MVSLIADNGHGFGFLVSEDSFGDFRSAPNSGSSDDANSGIFIRCTDPQKIGAKTGYEVNIYDKRPDPTYGTGRSSTSPRSSRCQRPAAWNL